MNPPIKSRKRLNNGCLNIVLDGTRQSIIAGDFRPGARLPTEPQLQEQWGVSRSVVREAMKVLESQGLVRIEQGRGTFVSDSAHNEPLRQQLEWALLRAVPVGEEAGATPPPLDQWDALLDVRLVFEVGAAERAARWASDADLAAMQEAIAKMRGCPNDAAACSEVDFDFHRAIAKATRNPLWPTLLGSLHELLRRYLELAHHGPQNALMTANEHEAVLVAIRAGDDSGAAQAMRRHLQTSGHDLKVARRKKRFAPQKG